MDWVLKAERLKAFYVLDVFGERKVLKAVNGVDVEIPENKVYGIAGESGCGKTTLLKAVFAAIEPPLRLFDGKVYYRVQDKEIDVFSLNVEEKRKLRWEYISYIPQGSMSVLNPVKKIEVAFLDFLESHVGGKTGGDAFAVAKRHIGELGLPLKILDAYPHQLSGGMRQRVAIALATLLKPRIILADEPTTALDVVAQRAVVQLLRDVQRSLKNTVILVTHDMGVQANITTKMAIMYAGRIIEEGPIYDIFDKSLHPYTKYLINSLPEIGDKTIRESAPGSPPSLLNPPRGCPFHPRCPEAFDLCTREMPGFSDVGNTRRVACWLREGEDASNSRS